MNKDFFIGLDIGTSSVGYATTDTNYKILKHSNIPLWGVRLFEEAETAAERRAFRTTRRNLKRRKQRLSFLKTAFLPEVVKVDPCFFERLENSFFLLEDKKFSKKFSNSSKRQHSKDILFNDPNFRDKDFYKKYPTIYHLRLALINNEQGDFDIRELYLAIHHIFKHRGHFLYGDLNLDGIDFNIEYKNFIELLKHTLDDLDISILSNIKASDVHDILKNTVTVRDKSKKLNTLFENPKHIILKSVLDLLSGKTIKLSSIIEIDENDNLSFSLKNFEESKDLLSDKLGDLFDVYIKAKEIYDLVLLENLRAGCKYISDAKVKSYEKHKNDLKLLKKVLNDLNISKTKQDTVFKGKAGYSAYVSSFIEEDHVKKCKYDDFAKTLNNILKDVVQNKDANYIKEEIEKETFLPLQKSIVNSTIPYQIHKIELEKILENASHKFKFLNEVDNSCNLSLKEKLIKIFEFRIPYFVGPLNTKSPFSWCVRSNEKIYPWNFDKVVNLRESAENFIKRMTRNCTFLNEKTLPKESLTYQKFMVLNELNNLKINAVPISVDLKQKIYNDLFLQKNKVTQKSLKDYLKSLGLFNDKEDLLSGIDGDFKTNLKSHIVFKDILQRMDINAYQVVEDLIERKTLFPDDKHMLQQYIDEKYSGIFDENEISLILKVKCKDFGNLSNTFLTKVEALVDGTKYSILDAMWNTNMNLMQLLSNKYDFMSNVQKLTYKNLDDLSFSIEDFLEDSYVSPSVKRAIYQSYLLLKEISSLQGGAPKRVFIEVAKGDDKKERTVSRKDKLTKLYKDLKSNKELLDELNTYEDRDLQSKKLYLYFEQQGRCMYTGERINIHELDTLYDIDHIYPYSKSQDDSIINNKVLVLKTANAKKTDIYPISKDTQDKMRSFWSMLSKNGFISHEKYERLIRTTSLTDEELASFISRQLVETRQSTKIVTKLVDLMFNGKTEVVFSKARNVSEFRNIKRVFPKDVGLDDLFDNKNKIADPVFVKCRDLNDIHHAKDAYLNIVVGNVYHVKFTKDIVNFIKESHRKYSLNRVFDFDVKRGDEIAWIASDGGTIEKVRHYLKKNNVKITYKSYKKTGQMQKEKVGSSQGTVPFKYKDERLSLRLGNGFKYGGYKTAPVSYYAVVQHDDKQSIIPIYIKNRSEFEKDKLAYINTIYPDSKNELLYSSLFINTQFVYQEGDKELAFVIKGKTGDSFTVKSTYQIIFDPIWNVYLNKINKFVSVLDAQSQKKNKDQVVNFSDQYIFKYFNLSKDRNIEFYQLIINKIENSPLILHFDTLKEKIEDKLEVFKELDISKQAQTLSTLIKLLTKDKDRVCFKDLGYTSSYSYPSISFKRFLENSTILNKSVTSVYISKVCFKKE